MGLLFPNEFSFLFVEYHEIPVCSFFRLVKVPMNGSKKHLVYQPFLLNFLSLPRDVLCSIIQVISETIKQCWTLYWALGYTSGELEFVFWSQILEPGWTASFPSPSLSAYLVSTSSVCRRGCYSTDSVKSLTKVEINNTHQFSPHPSS